MAHSLTDSLTDSFAFASVFVFVSIHSLSSLSDHIILTCFVCLSCQIACCLRLLTMRGPHSPAPSPAAPLQAQLSTLASSTLPTAHCQAPHSSCCLHSTIFLRWPTSLLAHFTSPLCLLPPGWSGPTRACLFVSRQALGLMPP